MGRLPGFGDVEEQAVRRLTSMTSASWSAASARTATTALIDGSRRAIRSSASVTIATALVRPMATADAIVRIGEDGPVATAYRDRARARANRARYSYTMLAAASAVNSAWS